MDIRSLSWYLVMLFCLPAIQPAMAQEAVLLEVDSLPRLNIPRAGHKLFFAGGEYVVAGGHTDGFVPTPTAEYYRDGAWHTLPMTYTHDFGISVVLKSGKVLLAGGCEQPAGIGQTLTAEIYDPMTHTFRGFGNMQRKRVWASALELDSGQVVIAGNWYAQDGIELFSESMSRSGDFLGKSSFTYIKDVEAQRSTPYIFRIASDDALILGSRDTAGGGILCSFADRLKGDTVHIPLFDTWQPLLIASHHDEASLIGKTEEGDYTYLLAVHDSTGQVAIAKACGTDFSLLKTSSPVPMQYQGEDIEYYSNIIADREAQRAYLMGINRSYYATPGTFRLFVLCIDYAHASDSDGAPLHLCYTDSIRGAVPDCPPLLTPEGNLLIVGGLLNNSNFTPSSAAWLLRLGESPEVMATGLSWWIWALLVLVVSASLCLLLYKWRASRKHVVDATLPSGGTCEARPSDVSSGSDDLLERINRLMEDQRLYLNSDLQLNDVAIALGTNRNIVSNCINSQCHCSFSQYITTYRINHAKDLMRRQPDIKIVEVWTASGFTTESYFFRSFKAVTGMTPSEWKQIL